MLLDATTHKLCFPKYDSTEDPLPCLHRCEQFLEAVRASENEKVWPTSLCIEGAS
jgi:hypothetical protein